MGICYDGNGKRRVMLGRSEKAWQKQWCQCGWREVDAFKRYMWR